MTQVFEVTDSSFKSEVLEAQGQVVVDFWAPWCGPCKQLGPGFEEVATEKADQVKCVKVNIDDNPEIASELGIRSIPTLMLFKDGQKIESKLGAMSKTAIISWLDGVKA
jgi:thioredoxin 1